MIGRLSKAIAALWFSGFLGLGAAPAHGERFITLASTTSTQQSGLLDAIIPQFTARTGIDVRVVAVGTGQALTIAARGDADALLVHDRQGEEKFVTDGHGIDRRDVMFNDFVLIGPRSDPARVGGLSDAKRAMKLIADAGAPFASRGDDSGTHRLELRLWLLAGVTERSKSWYRELGSGMGPTLMTAAGLDSYVLADRATWASFNARGDLVLLVSGDPALYNPYGSILVNPAKGAHIKAADAKEWHEWLTTAAGQSAIIAFKVGGVQLFYLPGTKPQT